ncbi:MAG: MFS transporter [Zoogloeaceae bacterium]|nr:MFS transporter [Zoogloeaceae bacterium]
MSVALSRTEWRAGLSLAAIFALRMLGLFLILPVFTLYAPNLSGGDNKLLVGLALGAYAGVQALLQMLWGAASDRWGRKPVIAAGLLLFALGGGIAALADNIWQVILGRAVQGAGAVSAAVTALAADLTHETKRARVMAMIGAAIGLVFALSMAIASPLFHWIGMPGIFWTTSVAALLAIFLLFFCTPDPDAAARPSLTSSAFQWRALADAQILRLNAGVFFLHCTQMALWIIVPAAISTVARLPAELHWQIYLPAVLVALVAMIPAIIAAEKKGKMKQVLTGAILLLLVTLGGLYATGLFLFGTFAAWAFFFCLALFFTAFNILEATQPSLISRLASAHSRGAALGLYNTFQSLGLFMGGAAGGALAQHGGAGAVLTFSALLIILWLALAAGLDPYARKTTERS